MALAQDGSVRTGGGVPGASVTVQLTTTSGNVVLLCSVVANGGTVSSITGGLTWTERATAGGTNFIKLWYATSVGALTNQDITVNFAGGETFHDIIAFGISGADTATVFDSNAALPNIAVGGANSITTSNANDFLLHVARSIGEPTPQAGWTEIQTFPNFHLVQYLIVAATQSSLSVDEGDHAVTTGSIADAIMAGAAATYGQTLAMTACDSMSGRNNPMGY